MKKVRICMCNCLKTVSLSLYPLLELYREFMLKWYEIKKVCFFTVFFSCRVHVNFISFFQADLSWSITLLSTHCPKNYFEKRKSNMNETLMIFLRIGSDCSKVYLKTILYTVKIRDKINSSRSGEKCILKFSQS